MRRHGVWLVVLMACLGACDEDDLVTDAAVELMSERPAADLISADIAIEVGDVPVDVESAPDMQRSDDCPFERCTNGALFVVRDFFQRFGPEAYDVEVTACRADVCASARVYTSSNYRNMVTNRDASVDAGHVSAPGYSIGLVVYLILTAPPSFSARSEDVSFRVVTTYGGRLLFEHSSRLPVEVYCPGGRHCGVCEQITVEIDGADGGRPIDAHSPPSPDICQ